MTDDTLHRGVADVAVARTTVSEIDGENGTLTVGGYPIEDLAPNACFEESCFLLLYDRLPTADECDSFRQRLGSHRQLPGRVVLLLEQAASANIGPMNAVRMGVSGLELDEFGPTEQAIRLIGKLPTVVATYWRYRSGTTPVDSDDRLGHAANYLCMLTGSEPAPAAVQALETYLTTVIDHGLNASTFVARSIVSTESDLVSAVTGAVGALKGPRHGGAPGDVLELLERATDEEDPAATIESQLDAGRRVPGFGHRVYRTRDPRAAVLEREAARLAERSDDDSLYETATQFERLARERLAAHKPDRQLETNVEFYTAVGLSEIAIPRELFTPTFAVARVAGWTAHCIEELDDPKLVRPTSIYDGPRDREWTPLEKR